MLIRLHDCYVLQEISFSIFLDDLCSVVLSVISLINLIADLGVVSTIPAGPHTFVKID